MLAVGGFVFWSAVGPLLSLLYISPLQRSPLDHWKNEQLGSLCVCVCVCGWGEGLGLHSQLYSNSVSV